MLQLEEVVLIASYCREEVACPSLTHSVSLSLTHSLARSCAIGVGLVSTSRERRVVRAFAVIFGYSSTSRFSILLNGFFSVFQTVSFMTFT